LEQQRGKKFLGNEESFVGDVKIGATNAAAQPTQLKWSPSNHAVHAIPYIAVSAAPV
jgi:hypothetical protein